MKSTMRAIAVLAVLFVLSGVSALLPKAAWGQDASKTAEPVDFSREIKPLFARRCFSCHGPDKAEGGLRLNERETALAEVDSGSHAIVPGQPEDSELLARVTADDESLRMPPEGKPLTPAEVESLRRWIADGAKWEGHWAFQPPVVQSPPTVKTPEWIAEPIDAFILKRLEANGLSPAAPADKRVLIRRAYFDLTGLPPTPEEVAAFVADESPAAYEQLIDRLLESPRYGERWARHWLDLVRFAETNSYERDSVKPNAWKYRDYLIRAFNNDKPYDQFVREQLAGDELPVVTPETIIASGYYRLGVWDDEPADPLLAKYDELDDIITTTSQVFLGLTINCARCHDHKIDPIPQTDYYQMLSFFHDLTPYGNHGDQTTYSQTDISKPELREEYARLEREQHELREQMKVIEQRGIVKMSAEDQRKSETRARKNLLDEKLQEYLDEGDWKQHGVLKEKLQKSEQTLRELPPRESALSVAQCLPQPLPTHVHMRGNPHVPGEAVEPGFPTIFNTPAPTIPKAPEGAHSSGRRLVLANWIAAPDNMLTGRVIVNRIWQHHFGRGIVRSTNNFGQLGDQPTHPELLDWLAQTFVDSGWRMKPLHRMIMLSNTYRMSSQANPKALEKDPRNDLYWRFDMRRLSAEEIRDAIHAVSGQLNLQMYGPGIYPEISSEVLASQSRPGSGWGKSTPEEQARRSVYIHVKRTLITPILANFDFPETDGSCEARFITTQPTQALGMLNGAFLHKQAVQFADRLRREAGDDLSAQIARALELALCRPATERERARGVKLVTTLQTKHELDERLALSFYCLKVLNLNEFMYLD